MYKKQQKTQGLLKSVKEIGRLCIPTCDKAEEPARQAEGSSWNVELRTTRATV